MLANTRHTALITLLAALLLTPSTGETQISREPPSSERHAPPMAEPASAPESAPERLPDAPSAALGADDPSQGEARPRRDVRAFGFPLAGYTPNTSVAFGGVGVLRFRTPSNPLSAPASTASLAALYTLRRQWLVSLDPSIRIHNDEWRINSMMLVRNWHTDFYGVGPDSREQDLEEYVPLSVEIDFELQRTVLHPNLYAGATAQFSYVRMQERDAAGALVTGQIIGSEGGRTAGPGFSLTWDSRDVPRFPTEGAYIHAELGALATGLGSSFDFKFATLDGRVFKDVGIHRRHILAGRALFRTTGGEVPFYEMPQLGGQALMRGIPADRYRDHNLWATQVEYRTPLFWRIGFAAFGALGQVFSQANPIDALPKWSAGVGARLRVDRESGLNLRLDYGISQENFTGIYFSVSEAF